MGVEIELKFAADEGTLAAIREQYPGGQKLQMSTTYYDTPEGLLAAKRYTLRCRQENSDHICTVKIPLDCGRGEWEVPDTDILNAIPRLCAMGAPEDLMAMTKNGVIPICGARFTRQAVAIEQTDFTAELAMDTGVLIGGKRETPLCEVELEYKSGNMAAFETFAATFAKIFRLSLEPRSKFRRALDLYLGVK